MHFLLARKIAEDAIAYEKGSDDNLRIKWGQETLLFALSHYARESAKAEQAPCGDVAQNPAGNDASNGAEKWDKAMRPAESAPIRVCGQELDEEALLSAIEHCDALEPGDVRGAVKAYLQAAKTEQPDTLVARLRVELENAYKAGADCEIEIRALKKELNTIKFTIRPEAVSPDREAGNEFFRKTFFWNTQPFTSTVQRQSMLESISPSAGDAVYGYCPVCGAKGVKREKRPFGNDICDNRHEYLSATAVQLTPESKAEDDDFERRITALFTKWAGCYGSAPAKMIRELRSIASVTPL